MLKAEVYQRLFRWLLLAMMLLLVCTVVLAGNLLRLAHGQIDEHNPELPTPNQVRLSFQVNDLPTALNWYNTATQLVPRHLVLDAQVDPEPGGNYAMGFPAFVLSWPDGRQFVIDAGLSAAEAKGFGRPMSLLGADELTFHGELTRSVDPKKLRGVGFTHLHVDHTAGILNLCEDGAAFTLVQTVEQYQLLNYATFGPSDSLQTLACAQRLLLADDGLLRSVQGFPGLYLVHVAGHTPGSQVFVAHVRQGLEVSTYVLAGDIANHQAGIEHNIAKPDWYSRWVIPENSAQLDRIRQWLAGLDRYRGIEVLVSHDLDQLRNSSLPEIQSVPLTAAVQSAP